MTKAESLDEAVCKLSLNNEYPATKHLASTIVFLALDSQGHLNSLIGIANFVKSKFKVRTVFLFINSVANNLEQLGHEVYDASTPDLSLSNSNEPDKTKFDIVVQVSRSVWIHGDKVESLEACIDKGFKNMIKDIQHSNSAIECKLNLLKPNCIFIDHYFTIPAVHSYIEANKLTKFGAHQVGVSWIRIFSAQPLALHPKAHQLPAQYLGLPTNTQLFTPKDKEINKIAHKMHQDLYEFYANYFESFKFSDTVLPSDSYSCVPMSPSLNLYMYPDELNEAYPQLDGWTRCENILRDFDAKPFDASKHFDPSIPGKLVYLSLGSLASADVLLVERLVKILAKSPHRFIVSKGVNGDKLELPPNMWGENHVNQLEILQSIDLIVTHGGNNTIVESFYFGVPGFIVMPLFSDQFDNAQRIVEANLGVSLDPYNCTETQLLDAIQLVLANQEAFDVMKRASKRMQDKKLRNKACDEVVEALCKDKVLTLS